MSTAAALHGFSSLHDIPVGKIRHVIAECFRVPLAEPLYDAGHGRHDFFELVVCRIETMAGVTGVGYTYTGGTGGRAIAEFIRTDLSALVLGRDASDIAAIWHHLQSSLHYVGRGGLLSFAISALDIALWDAVCRAADIPLAVALSHDAPAASVEAYSGFIDLHLEGEALGNLADRALAKGFVGFKTKVGRGVQAEDVARVKLMRDAIGGDKKLMVDANYSFNVTRAISLSRAIEHLNIEWFEEPISPDNFEGYAEVANQTRIPVAMGENLHTIEEVERAIRYSQLSFLQLDASNIGGITGWLAAAARAEAAGISVCSHGMHELHVSLLAARAAPTYLEWHSFPIDQLTHHPLDLCNGRVVPPDRPGVGVEFDEARLRPHRIF